MQTQPGILASVPALARYQFYSLINDCDYPDALNKLCQQADGESIVIGLGQPLIQALQTDLEGLHSFPTYFSDGVSVPSTPMALWVWYRGTDRGTLLHLSRALEHAVAPAFQLEKTIDAFKYGPSLDLTGYEDGTENPEGDEAVDAGIVSGKGAGMDGSSYLAVQQWVHDLDHFEAMPTQQQDDAIGRRKSDNEELDDAPESAHVKRTAQESFNPEAFILRRSMPWADDKQAGLVFTAFGHSLDAFEALLKRMVGEEDGTVDALFSFTQPVSGAYFWCPPMKDNRLDLSAIK